MNKQPRSASIAKACVAIFITIDVFGDYGITRDLDNINLSSIFTFHYFEYYKFNNGRMYCHVWCVFVGETCSTREDGYFCPDIWHKGGEE